MCICEALPHVGPRTSFRQLRWQPEPSRSILIAPPDLGRITLSDTFDRLKTALADRYGIERELGSGGMATVDAVLDVAQRDLPPDA